LLRYAARFGVGRSPKVVVENALCLSHLIQLVSKSNEMRIGVYGAKQANHDSRIFAPHFFAFGGVLETARGLRAVVSGSFELAAAGGGFTIRT
jgi:hypothetical protein